MYYKSGVLAELGKLLDVDGEYQILIVKNLNNELKKIIIKTKEYK